MVSEKAMVVVLTFTLNAVPALAQSRGRTGTVERVAVCSKASGANAGYRDMLVRFPAHRDAADAPHRATSYRDMSLRLVERSARSLPCAQQRLRTPRCDAPPRSGQRSEGVAMSSVVSSLLVSVGRYASHDAASCTGYALMIGVLVGCVLSVAESARTRQHAYLAPPARIDNERGKLTQLVGS